MSDKAHSSGFPLNVKKNEHVMVVMPVILILARVKQRDINHDLHNAMHLPVLTGLTKVEERIADLQIELSLDLHRAPCRHSRGCEV